MKSLIKINDCCLSIGYLAIETNYGEEYVDMRCLFKMNNLSYDEIFRLKSSELNG